MISHNTSLESSFKSPIKILQNRSIRSDLPMSNAARKQLHVDSEDVRNTCKHVHLPIHDLHVSKSQEATTLQPDVLITGRHKPI